MLAVLPRLVQIILMVRTGDPVAAFVPGRRAIKEFDLNAAEEARNWLNECQDKHENCLRPSHAISAYQSH